MNKHYYIYIHFDNIFKYENKLKDEALLKVFTWLINGEAIFTNGQRILAENSPNSEIFNGWVSDDLVLGDELFSKALRKFATCLSIDNKWCRKSL